MKKLAALFIALSLAISFNVYAQEDKDGNVAPQVIPIYLSDEPKKIPIRLRPGQYKIHIFDTLPDTRYQINITLEDISYPVLPAVKNPDIFSNEKGVTKSQKKNNYCTLTDDQKNKIKAAVAELVKKDEFAEKKFGRRKAELLIIAKEVGWPNCKLEPNIEKVLHSSYKLGKIEHLETIKLRRGQKMVVTILRAQDHSDEKTSWEHPYETPLLGKWRAYWGVLAMPNNDESYFTKDSGGGKFVISEKEDHNGWDPSFGAFYTWHFLAPYPGLDTGPVAGLGFNKENLIVFLGWNLTWAQNIGINAGIALHEQERLKGQYTNGEVLSAAVASDELTEDVYQPNLYLGLTFRF